MAFGKDNSQLDNIVGYGGTVAQRAANATRRSRRGGGGGGRPYWADSFRLNEYMPDLIRLVAGQFKTLRIGEDGNIYEETTPWKEVLEHYHGGLRRGGLCSAGPYVFADRNKREPCIGCDIFWESYEERKATGVKGRGPISVSDRYVFIVIDMGVFHKVPQVDDNGQIRMNPKTNKSFMTWSKCTGPGCQGCQMAQETKRGYIQPWSMNKSHFQTLTEGYSYSIGTCCTTCRGRGVISTLSWHCGNPQCGAVIFDMRNTTATADQIKEVVHKPYFCRQCGTTMYPLEQIHCVNCAAAGNTTPQRATIFDVDMQVMGVKPGDGTQVNLVVHATSDPKPLDAEFQDLLKYAPNLDKRFAPSTLQEQARLWHRHAVGQPQQAQQPAQYAQPYSQPTQPVAHPGMQPMQPAMGYTPQGGHQQGQ